MNPSPFDGSLDGPSSPVVAPQERNTALYSHRQSARGFSLRSGAAQGPGEVLFIFWALARSTKTALVVSNFCPPLHPLLTRDTDWKEFVTACATCMAVRGAAMAGAAKEEP
jgi:hypothetical protein